MSKIEMSGDDDVTHVPIGDGFLVVGWSDDDEDDACYIGLRVASMSGIMLEFPIDSAKTLIGGLQHAIQATERGAAQRKRERTAAVKKDGLTTTPSA